MGRLMIAFQSKPRFKRATPRLIDLINFFDLEFGEVEKSKVALQKTGKQFKKSCMWKDTLYVFSTQIQTILNSKI